MMEIHAPWPGSTGILKLPNPDLADARRLGSSVQLKRAMSGVVVTHIKKRTVSKVYKYKFMITRYKALELLEFMRIHLGQTIRILWSDLDLVGVVKTNPIEIAPNQRAIVADSVEQSEWSFEFETTQ